MREQLPAGLGAPESKVRTAVGAAVAAIYNFDGDSGWPGLIEMLVAAIKARSDPILGERLELGRRYVICLDHTWGHPFSSMGVSGSEPAAGGGGGGM